MLLYLLSCPSMPQPDPFFVAELCQALAFQPGSLTGLLIAVALVPKVGLVSRLVAWPLLVTFSHTVPPVRSRQLKEVHSGPFVHGRHRLQRQNPASDSWFPSSNVKFL